MSQDEVLVAGALFLFTPVPVWHLTLHARLSRWRRSPGLFYAVCALEWLLFAPVAVYSARNSGDLFELPDALQPVCFGISVLTLAVAVWSIQALTPRRFFLWSVLHSEESGGRRTASGPYLYLRHPAYVSIVLTMTAASLATGSTVLLVATPAICAALVVVTRLEEKELRTRLAST